MIIHYTVPLRGAYCLNEKTPYSSIMMIESDGQIKLVRPVNPSDTVVILSATYEIYECETLVDSGTYDIDDTTLSMLYSADTAGIFTLKTTVKVGAETIIDYCKIVVRA